MCADQRINQLPYFFDAGLVTYGFLPNRPRDFAGFGVVYGSYSSHQHGATRLEDLVVGPDADGGEILLGVDAASGGDGLVQDVMDGPHGQREVEEVVQEFGDAAEGTVANEGESEDELPQPRLGDRKPKEEWGGLVARRGEGMVQGVMRLLELLVDELTADLLLAGQFGDGLAGQGVEGELLACLGRQQACGCGDGGEPGRMPMPGTPWIKRR